MPVAKKSSPRSSRRRAIDRDSPTNAASSGRAHPRIRLLNKRNIDVQMANADRARAAIANLDAQLRRIRATFGKGAVTNLAEASDRAGLAVEELRKSERRRQYQELRSPVDGVVQQLAITTIGGVVQPAQALMVIVPCAPRNGNAKPDPSRCTSAVEVEAFVQNKDIGFVKVGQRVAVKLEAFN